MKVQATAAKVPSYTIKTKAMKSSGFDILSLSGNDRREYDSSHPHRHNFFEILYFSRTGGSHEVDFHQYPVVAHTAHFVSPGQIHKLSLRGASGFVICFTEDLVPLGKNESLEDRFRFFSGETDSIVSFDKALSEEISCLIEQARRDLTITADRRNIFSAYLQIILLKLDHEWSQRHPAAQRASAGNSTVQRFKKLVNAHYQLHQPLTAYADQLHISANHLNALCRKHTGSSAIQLIHQRLLLESKRMLAATDLSVKEIAYALQFSDVAYFTRFFKKHSGFAPNSYRQTSLKNR